jgi:ATP-dependent DNA ligase
MAAFFSDETDAMSDTPFIEPNTYRADFDETGTILYEHSMTNLVKAWEYAIAHNHEGLIIKDQNSNYVHERSFKWKKVKNWRFKKLNVVGYTPGQNARTSFFGALVLANEKGEFAGCVGSGFDSWELRKWKNHFGKQPSMTQPFSSMQVGSPYTAVKSDWEVLVKYYQTTPSGVMRFPIYCLSTETE